MFVTEKEAEDRLSSKRNILREGGMEDHEVEDLGAEETEEVGEAWEDPDIDDIKLPSLSGKAALDNLEKIIADGGGVGGGRAHYKMKRESQKAIGEVDLLLGGNKTGALFGLTAPQAYAYGEGKQGTDVDSIVIKEVRDHVEMVKLDIAAKAVSRLQKVMVEINGPRIEAVKDPLKLAVLGKDLAAIVEKVAPRALLDPDRGGIVVYRPETAPVSSYNVVNINMGVKKAEELDEKEKKFYDRTLEGVVVPK